MSAGRAKTLPGTLPRSDTPTGPTGQRFGSPLSLPTPAKRQACGKHVGRTINKMIGDAKIIYISFTNGSRQLTYELSEKVFEGLQRKSRQRL